MISEKLTGFWHGADYNPDQWLDYPEILKKDVELMKKSNCNVMSVGIFSWTMLEPEEGKFQFEWMDQVIDRLYHNGIYTILATPSGAMPAWMAQKYPEILRTEPNGIKRLYGRRHNHCFTSPIYREKVKIINTELARRYAKHPGVVMWHVSNEYNGECHCPLCIEAFRSWLKEKYGTLEALNKAWWNNFWSHAYTDWSQVSPPTEIGEDKANSLNLEWRRFVSHQTLDFFKEEVKPLKEANPKIPVTANLMQFDGLDYYAFAKEMDFVSWDNYPRWHQAGSDTEVAVLAGFYHDLFRSMKKDRPFMMMESTPANTNWHAYAKLKKPGVHILSSIQAVAHGSDTVQYFQWRKSRGSSEQFHGAVVGHDGTDQTHVFKEVQQLGSILQTLKPAAGTLQKNQVGILYEYDNLWALSLAHGYRNNEEDKGFYECLLSHYRQLWDKNIGVDILSAGASLDGYSLIIAPMLFMVKEGVAQRLESFVEKGGTLVATYASGIVNDTGLCFFGGFPGPLRKLLGIWSEDTEVLTDGEENAFGSENGTSYPCKNYCDLVHPESAKVLMEFQKDFYQGMPAVTVNRFGRGKAFYLATQPDQAFLSDFYDQYLGEKGIKPQMATPDGVNVQMRESKDEQYIFIMNFNPYEVALKIPFKYNLLYGTLEGQKLGAYAVAVMRKEK